MENTLNKTPSASRTHIGFFGRMNAGKSSIVNAFTGQSVSIVSDTAGTTTDVVTKSMEIHGIGPCILLDTAGFDDTGALGSLRTEAARKAADRCDIAVVVFSPLENASAVKSTENREKQPAGTAEGTRKAEDYAVEREWIARFRDRETPVIGVIGKADTLSPEKAEEMAKALSSGFHIPVLPVSAVTREGIVALKEEFIRSFKQTEKKRYITGDLVERGDAVLLVMPQDIQAPDGRLILPQVQTIRELLDRKCVVTCCTTDELDDALSQCKEPPKLIITDSQVFDRVYEKKPEKSLLTSFSILFAAYKGDIDYYVESAKAIDKLTEDSRVLIAECCTHAPLEEDIGRVKIPRFLRKKAGEGLTIDMMAGADFPENLEDYDLVIQCGACMFNRKFVLARTARAKAAGVPMTNYGVTIAHLKGILGKVETGAKNTRKEGMS